MQTKNETEVVADIDNEVEESLDLPQVADDQEDTTDWKAEAQKLRDKAISQRERTKALKQELATTKKAVEIAVGSKKEAPAPKTSELDETQLDYLDLKGISEAEDIKLIERHVQRTGETVRQALKDEYVQAKLKANETSRAVREATPSSTRRGGSQADGFEIALAKAEKDPTDLPADFALRSKVVNAMADKANTNKPRWHR